MGAFVKSIDIHGNNLRPLMEYVSNEEKTDLVENGFEDLFNYVENDEKTGIVVPGEEEKVLLTSGVLCNPNTADQEFAAIRTKYRENNPEFLPSFDYLNKKVGETVGVSKQPVVAIHLIQSFAETDIDPRIAHAIGVTLAERLGVQAVVSTHCNQDTTSKYGAKHIHNHVVCNAYLPDGMSKLCMNKNKLMEVRKLSDEIQREFGIEITFLDPEMQLKVSKARSMNYGEWTAHRNGTGWKDRVKGDIRLAKRYSNDIPEFIERMKLAGYTPKTFKGGDGDINKASSIMWINPQNGKKIWDSTLGKDFVVSNIFKNKSIKEVEIERPADDLSVSMGKIKPVSIARYDINGRRRGDLELLIRKAIRIIQRVAMFFNKFKIKNRLSDISYNANEKINAMQEALKTLEDFEIDSLSDLSDKIDVAGKNVNIIKSAVSRLDTELGYYSVVEKLINQYEQARHLYDSVVVWNNFNIDFRINSYSKRDISLSKARISPLSMKQKTELYQMMEKHPDLRIDDAGKNYSNVSAIQFRAIRDFFRGKGEMPDCLISKEEAGADYAYEKQYENLTNKISYEPKRNQKNTALFLLRENGHYINDDFELTMADVINISNCYGPNPFTSPLISEDKAKTLEKIVSDAGKELNRRPTSIMESEYEDVVKFLNGEIKATPDVLKIAGSPASETDVNKTKILATKMGVEVTVPIEDMTSNDVRNLYGWLISQGKEPVCVRKSSFEENKKAFHEDIEGETPKKQQIAISLRNAINSLAQLGISIDDIPEMKSQIEKTKNERANLDVIKEEFTGDYKQLLRLRQQVSYATDKTFLYGSLFDNKELQEMEKEAKEQEVQEVQETREEKEVEQSSIKETQKNKKKHKVLDGGFDI